MNKNAISNVATIVEKCQQLIEQIGTPLNEQPNLSPELKEAVEHLGKAHASLLRALTLLG